MTAPNEPYASRPKSSGNCCLYGCLGVCVLAIALIVGGYLAASYALGAFTARYTATQPLQFPPARLEPGVRAALDARLEEFGRLLQAGGGGAPLTLRAEEINALIASQPHLSNVFRVAIEGQQLKARVSLPLGGMPLPVLQSYLEGRYLNGEAAVDVAIEKGQLSVKLRSFTVNGSAVPAQIATRIERAFLQSAGSNPQQMQEAVSALESIRVENEQVILAPKPQVR